MRMCLVHGGARAALLATAVLWPRFAQAQPPIPPYRQAVVVTASATPVELDRVTRTLTVISRDQIDALPVHTIADVLRLTSAVDVRARGERGAQTDFAIRGANFGQVLVLVDGVRLNDAQSGHHNGDIPVPLDAVERIEVLRGPASSLYGADAFGGTVNIITRRESVPSLLVQGGSFGFMAARGQAGFERGTLRQTFSASAERSSGFIYDRDFATAVAHARSLVGDRSSLSLSILRKEFGANNFYGGNAPSREWTNQAMVALDHQLFASAGWTASTTISYRTHGDRFLFNQEQPLLSDNRHRTHAALAGVAATRRAAGDRATVTVGIEAGGDWIRSTNLGNHAIDRVSGFAEWRHDTSRRLHWDASLRVDRYSEFGVSANPSLGFGWWAVPRGGAGRTAASPAVRLRASVGRAFRVPTFTERFYSDPANLARAEVGPETAWSGEGGVDLFLGGGWVADATAFGRADRDVIDWLRPTAAERWRTYNIRQVATRGVEAGVRRTFAGGAFVQGHFTGLDVDAAAVDQLSKYVLDYAPRSFTSAASIPLPAGFHVAPRLEYRRRTRSSGTADYVLLDARVGRRLARTLDLFVEGTNLFDVSYQEVAGVPMPGVAMTVSLALRAR
jgi:iron complex outermembrane receptor protein